MSDTCKDCFNGCLERVPDNCVRYTGIDIPELGIEKGNSLAYIQSQIFEYIRSIVSGEGIKIDLVTEDLCTIISDNLPTEGVINLQQVIFALSTAICSINTLVSQVIEQSNILEFEYDTDFFTLLPKGANTHIVLQETINVLETLYTNFNTLLNTLETSYVTSSNIDEYIENYNETVVGSLLMRSKMIPYTAVLYFPTPAILSGKFDLTGAGIATFIKIYMCNGANGTPNIPNPVGGYYIMYIP